MGRAAKLKAARKSSQVEDKGNIKISKKSSRYDNDEDTYNLSEEELVESNKRVQYFFAQINKVKGIKDILEALSDSKNYLFSKEQLHSFYKTVYQDLSLFSSMCRELEGIKNRKSDISAYAIARKTLYRALVELYIENEFIDNIREQELHLEIIKAGQILWDSEGMKGMKDYLLWSFIPDSQKSLIDILWHGIGDWRIFKTNKDKFIELNSIVRIKNAIIDNNPEDEDEIDTEDDSYYKFRKDRSFKFRQKLEVVEKMQVKGVFSKVLAVLYERHVDVSDMRQFLLMCLEVEKIEANISTISKWTESLYVLYKALAELYMEDEFIEEIKEQKLHQEIIKASKMLYQSEEEVYDSSLWDIVPESQHQTIKDLRRTIEDHNFPRIEFLGANIVSQQKSIFL